MNINWKLRLKNKATLLSLIGVTLSFVYTLLGAIGIVPSITEDSLHTICLTLVEVLAAIGIVVDPTTEGIEDSNRALSYNSPKKVD